MTDWLLVVSTVTPIVVAVVTATAWITRKVTAVEKDVEGLEKRLNTAEGDIRDMFNRIYEQSQRDAAELRQDIRSMKSGG